MLSVERSAKLREKVPTHPIKHIQLNMLIDNAETRSSVHEQRARVCVCERVEKSRIIWHFCDASRKCEKKHAKLYNYTAEETRLEETISEVHLPRRGGQD